MQKSVATLMKDNPGVSPGGANGGRKMSTNDVPEREGCGNPGAANGARTSADDQQRNAVHHLNQRLENLEEKFAEQVARQNAWNLKVEQLMFVMINRIDHLAEALAEADRHEQDRGYCQDHADVAAEPISSQKNNQDVEPQADGHDNSSIQSEEDNQELRISE
ncbi:hypothetical protein CBR_g55884 [Chara braunii]|uniref:Uncharacterized protein n=1 Tax=Chara braunii TaxID=69332 RepID=A0A388MDK2_CHABU|nr:hypothetical protein CBR_g55884 [Chara braunii]|eukprot:GBG92549.1 hypothetical protein CBR_g55884 [Chara braunii]